MNANELLNQILSYFEKYEQNFNKTLIKDEEKILMLRKPQNLEANYLFYEVIGEYGREDGIIYDLEDFLSLIDDYEFAIERKEEKNFEVDDREENTELKYEYSNYGFPLERNRR